MKFVLFNQIWKLLLFIFTSVALFVALKARTQNYKALESIILAGDAGVTRTQILEVLAAEAVKLPGKTTVYFLGDNIYPAGLPEVGDKDYSSAKERLDKQIRALKGLPVKTIFIPGNHDWDNAGAGGLEKIKNQELAVVSELGAGSFLPSNGCPGPVVAEERSWVRVIVINSQWWLHAYEQPSSKESGCSAWDKETILARLRELIKTENPEMRTIVLSHHPLESVGLHANSGTSAQDFNSPDYQRMRGELLAVLNQSKPLICAAGHDHSLQHLRGVFGCSNFVVSGAISHPSGVEADRSTLYARGVFGFMKVDYLENGTIRLQAFEYNRDQTDVAVSYEAIL